MGRSGLATLSAVAVLLAVVHLADPLPRRVVVVDGADAHVRHAMLTTGAPSEAEVLARDVFDRVNVERVHRGLHALVWDDELAARAGTWSTTMTTTGFEHSDGPFRATERYRATGENIAFGQLDTRELHVGWMRSDGHRANLLAAEAVALGVGIVCRGDGTLWSTQILGFASPAHPVPAPPPPGWYEPQPADPIVATRRGVSCPLDARG